MKGEYVFTYPEHEELCIAIRDETEDYCSSSRGRRRNKEIFLNDEQIYGQTTRVTKDSPHRSVEFGTTFSEVLAGNLYKVEFLSYVEAHTQTDARFCLYCKARMDGPPNVRLRARTRETWFSRRTRRASAHQCPHCGWWALIIDTRIHAGADNFGRVAVEARSAIVGVAKRFHISDKALPIEELRRWLARHPHLLSSTDATRFEKVMQDCFRDHYRGATVDHVGETGDGGVDIKLVQSDGEPVLIQVKRRKNPNAVEGLEVVRELNGVLLHNTVAKGIVVTTACRFTKGAHKEARIRPYPFPPFDRHSIKLIARDEVLSLLRPHRATPRPWSDLVKNARMPQLEWRRYLPSAAETAKV